MAKQIRKAKNILDSKKIIVTVFAAALVLVVGGVLLLNPQLTGNVVVCPQGNYIFSTQIEGNKDGYIAPINRAKVVLRSSDKACLYQGETDNEGNLNLRIQPGKYDVSIYKTGKCKSHSEEILITESMARDFRLQNCNRMFNI